MSVKVVATVSFFILPVPSLKDWDDDDDDDELMLWIP